VPFLSAWHLGRLAKPQVRANEDPLKAAQQPIPGKVPIHKAGARPFL
jgi:hypothetical protein